jgi:hypothetical protein
MTRMEATGQTIRINKRKRKKRERVSVSEVYAALEAVLPFAEDEVAYIVDGLNLYPEETEDAERGEKAIALARSVIARQSDYLRRKARALREKPGQADA